MRAVVNMVASLASRHLPIRESPCWLKDSCASRRIPSCAIIESLIPLLEASWDGIQVQEHIWLALFIIYKISLISVQNWFCFSLQNLGDHFYLWMIECASYEHFWCQNDMPQPSSRVSFFPGCFPQTYIMIISPRVTYLTIGTSFWVNPYSCWSKLSPPGGFLLALPISTVLREDSPTLLNMGCAWVTWCPSALSAKAFADDEVASFLAWLGTFYLTPILLPLFEKDIWPPKEPPEAMLGV